MENHWYFVINPISGKGKGLDLWHKIQSLLDQSPISYDFGISEFHTHTTQLIQTKYQEGIRHFIGLGGDGTVNEIINGIYLANPKEQDTKVVFGLFPIGTGNDWIRNHQALSLQNIISRIQTCSHSPHDVGLVHTTSKHYFLNVAGGGLDGMVAQQVAEQFNSGKKNALSYLMGAVKALISFKAPQCEAQIDQKKVYHGQLLLTVGSIGKFFGNGMQISPKAEIANGLVDFTIVKKDSNWVIFPQLYKLFNGQIHSADFVIKLSGKQLQVKCNSPIPLQADGEGLGDHREFKISIIKHGILVLD